MVFDLALLWYIPDRLLWSTYALFLLISWIAIMVGMCYTIYLITLHCCILEGSIHVQSDKIRFSGSGYFWSVIDTSALGCCDSLFVAILLIRFGSAAVYEKVAKSKNRRFLSKLQKSREAQNANFMKLLASFFSFSHHHSLRAGFSGIRWSDFVSWVWSKMRGNAPWSIVWARPAKRNGNHPERGKDGLSHCAYRWLHYGNGVEIFYPLTIAQAVFFHQAFWLV